MMAEDRRFYENTTAGALRSAPAALRNREPIAQVLREWLPEHGLVLEIASGTGEHISYFAECFPTLEWQPSDVDAGALASISAWSQRASLPNLRSPLVIDAAQADWPVERADALLSINMVHISPWTSALGLIESAARILVPGAPLILYGPWITDAYPTAPTNLAFDADLRRRHSRWGLRRVEDFVTAAEEHGLRFSETRAMPANNLMLLFRA